MTQPRENYLTYIYLSSSNPDMMKFQMVKGRASSCVMIAYYYLNPNRIDVYTNNGQTNVQAKNAFEENGVFKFRTDGGDYMPTCSDSHGSNFIDRDNRLLYVVIKGDQNVILKRAKVVMVSFGLPGMSEADFFGANIIENLAGKFWAVSHY